MTALACAIAFVAVLAFVDRMLSRQAQRQQPAAPAYDALPAINDIYERLTKVDGLADRVQELEAAAPADASDQVAKAEQKYDAIIRNGINECRNMIASALDPQLRTPMARALKSVKKE